MNIISSLRRNNGRLLRPISARGAAESFCKAQWFMIFILTDIASLVLNRLSIVVLERLFWIVP